MSQRIEVQTPVLSAGGAADALEETVGQLADNVAMASLDTDVGVIPIDALSPLGGFRL